MFTRINDPKFIHVSPDGEIRREINDSVAVYSLQGVPFARRDMTGLIAGGSLPALESIPSELPDPDVVAAGLLVQTLEAEEFSTSRRDYTQDFRARIGLDFNGG